MTEHFEGSGRSFMRGPETENITKLPFSEYLARRMLSKWKNDSSIAIVGERGSGKSYAALSLAHSLSEVLAKKNGGSPLDYFNIETNLAITSPVRTTEIMTHLKDLNIYILDDLGVSADSRRAMTKENVNLTQIFEICRIFNACLILTAPVGSLIDNRFRELVKFYGKMWRKFPDKQLTIMKVYSSGHDVFGHHRISKIHLSKHDVLAGLVVHKPPDHLCKRYDELRFLYTHEAINKMYTRVNPGLGTEGIQLTDIMVKYTAVKKLVQDTGISITKACAAQGMSRNSYNFYASRDPTRITKRPHSEGIS